MTKKDFRERCDTDSVYGNGAKRINSVYVDWSECDNHKGFKFGAATSIENCTKAELFNHVYDWIVNEVNLPYYIYYRVALTDAERFKTPIVFKYSAWS